MRLVLCDDIESSKNTRTLEARKTFQKKFTQEVLHLGDDKTNVILCGTMLSQDSLQGMIHLEKEIRGWEKLRYKAVVHFSPNGQLWDEWVAIYRGMSSFNQESGRDAAWRFFEARREAMLNGTKVLWNEYEDYYSLMVQKEKIGDYAFCSEKQNDPKEGAGLALDERCRPFWEDDGLTEHEMLRLFGGDLLMFGAADMAYSLKEGADFSVITTALLDRKSRTIYVLDSVGDRWKPEVFISQVVEMHKRRKYIEFVAESNGGQVWFPTADAIRKESCSCRSSSSERIEGQSYSGVVPSDTERVCEVVQEACGLWEQLSSYPHCRHDDYIDSLAMAVRAAQGHEQDGICTEERVEAMQAFCIQFITVVFA